MADSFDKMSKRYSESDNRDYEGYNNPDVEPTDSEENDEGGSGSTYEDLIDNLSGGAYDGSRRTDSAAPSAQEGGRDGNEGRGRGDRSLRETGQGALSQDNTVNPGAGLQGQKAEAFNGRVVRTADGTKVKPVEVNGKPVYPYLEAHDGVSVINSELGTDGGSGGKKKTGGKKRRRRGATTVKENAGNTGNGNNEENEEPTYTRDRQFGAFNGIRKVTEYSNAERNAIAEAERKDGGLPDEVTLDDVYANPVRYCRSVAKDEQAPGYIVDRMHKAMQQHILDSRGFGNINKDLQEVLTEDRIRKMQKEAAKNSKDANEAETGDGTKKMQDAIAGGGWESLVPKRVKTDENRMKGEALVATIDKILGEVAASGGDWAKAYLNGDGKDFESMLDGFVEEAWKNAKEAARKEQMQSILEAGASPFDDAAQTNLYTRVMGAKSKHMDLERLMKAVSEQIPMDLVAAAVMDEVAAVMRYDPYFDVRDIKDIEEYVQAEITDKIAQKVWDNALEKEREEWGSQPVVAQILMQAYSSTMQAQIQEYVANMDGDGLAAMKQAMQEWGSVHALESGAATGIGMVFDLATVIAMFAGSGGSRLFTRWAMGNIDRTVGARMMMATGRGTLAAAVGGGMANMGTFMGAHSVTEQLAEKGSVDAAEVMTTTLEGAAMGATMGGIGTATGKVGRFINQEVKGVGLRALGNAAVKSLGFGAEAAVFGFRDMMASDDAVEAWERSALSLLGMKIGGKINPMGAVEKVRDLGRPATMAQSQKGFLKTFKENLTRAKEDALTREERRMLRDCGYGDLLDMCTPENVEALLASLEAGERRQERGGRRHETASAEPQAETSTETFDSFCDRASAMLKDERLPESVRSTMHWIMTGESLPMSKAARVETPWMTGGECRMRAYNAEGGVIIDRTYRSAKDATAAYDDFCHAQQVAEIAEMERARLQECRQGIFSALDMAAREVFPELFGRSVGDRKEVSAKEMLDLYDRLNRKKARTPLTSEEEAFMKYMESGYDGLMEELGSKSPGSLKESARIAGIDIDKAILTGLTERTPEQIEAVNGYMDALQPMLTDVRKNKLAMDGAYERGRNGSISGDIARREAMAASGAQSIEEAEQAYEAWLDDLTPEERLEDMRRAGAPAEAIAEARERAMAMSAWKGVTDGIEGVMTAEKEQMMEAAKTLCNDRGCVQKLTLGSGQTVYVTNGRVAVTEGEDGSSGVDKGNSDEVIYVVDPKTGNRWSISPNDIAEAEPERTMEEMEQEADAELQAKKTALENAAMGRISTEMGETVELTDGETGAVRKGMIVGSTGDRRLVQMEDGGDPLLVDGQALQDDYTRRLDKDYKAYREAKDKAAALRGDGRYETGDGRQETGDMRNETSASDEPAEPQAEPAGIVAEDTGTETLGDMRQETGEKREGKPSEIAEEEDDVAIALADGSEAAGMVTARNSRRITVSYYDPETGEVKSETLTTDEFDRRVRLLATERQGTMAKPGVGDGKNGENGGDGASALPAAEATEPEAKPRGMVAAEKKPGLVQDERTARLGEGMVKLLDTVGKQLGLTIRFAPEAEVEGSGRFSALRREIMLSEENIPAEGSREATREWLAGQLRKVFGHETGHALKAFSKSMPWMWEAFRQSVIDYLGEGEFKRMVADVRERYEAHIEAMRKKDPNAFKNTVVDDNYAEEEVLVEEGGRLLMTDKEAMKKLLDRVSESGESPRDVIRKMVSWADGMMTKLREAWTPSDGSRQMTWEQQETLAALADMRSAWEGMYEYVAAMEREAGDRRQEARDMRPETGATRPEPRGIAADEEIRARADEKEDEKLSLLDDLSRKAEDAKAEEFGIIDPAKAWEALLEEAGGSAEDAKEAAIGEAELAEAELAEIEKKAEGLKGRAALALRQVAKAARAKAEAWRRIAEQGEERRETRDRIHETASAEPQAEPAGIVAEDELPVKYEEEDDRFSARMRNKKKENRQVNGTSPKRRFTGTNISPGETAKVQKKLDDLAKKYEKRPNNGKYFISNLAIMLGINDINDSNYPLVLPNGATLRLSAHNAHTETFAERGEKAGFSLVVTRKSNKGITTRPEDDVEITEYYYHKWKLEHTEGKPFAQIARDVSELIGTGHFPGTVPPDFVNSTYKDAEGKTHARTETWDEYQTRVNNTESDDKQRLSGELDRDYPEWLSGQTTETGQHTTQITSTQATYRRIGQHLLETGTDPKEVSVLDASSGLGVGTQALREMGFDVDDVEPYPSEEREKPTYSRYEDIDKKYDVVISNAVLNVIPDDWRAEVLHQMADKLNPGGRLFINVRDAAGVAAQKQKIELDSPEEILVTDKKGNIRAYQKGFTRKELLDYVKKELGDGYSVEIANGRNSGIASGTAVVVTKTSVGEDDRLYIGKKARAQYEAMLDKKRPEMPAEMKKEALDYDGIYDVVKRDLGLTEAATDDRLRLGDAAWRQAADETVAGMAESQRRIVAERAMENGGDFREAADSYLGELAGKKYLTSEERGVVDGLLTGMRGEMPGMSDKELRYEAWKKSRSKSGNGILDAAEEALKRYDMGLPRQETGDKGDDRLSLWDDDVTAKIASAEKRCKEALQGLAASDPARGMAVETDLGKLTEAREAMTAYIKTALARENMPAVKKRDLNNLLEQVNDIRSRGELEAHMRQAEGIVLDVDKRMHMRGLDNLIGTKVLDKDARGISKAKAVDDATRKGVTEIRSELKSLLLTELDGDLKQLGSEIYDIEKRRREGETIDEDYLEGLKAERGTLQGLRDAARQDNQRRAYIDYERKIAELRAKAMRATQDGSDEGFTEYDAAMLGAYMVLDRINKAQRFEWETEVNPTDGEITSHSLESLDEAIKKRKAVVGKPYDDILSNLKSQLDAETDMAERQRILQGMGDVRRDRKQAYAEDSEIRRYEEMKNLVKRQQLGLYRDAWRMLDMMVSGGRNALKDELAAEHERRREIAHNGLNDINRGKRWNHDRRGRRRDSTKDDRRSGVSRFVHGLFGTQLDSFDYMVQSLSTSQSGQGWMFKYFMEGENGVMEAHSNHCAAMRRAMERLNDACKHYTGKKFKEIARESAKKENHVITVCNEDGRETAQVESKGQAMYVYQLWNMTDGRMKLEKMGFTEQEIEECKRMMGSDLQELADWMVREYYPELGKRLNERHKEIYHTSMAEIENYVPIRIDPNAVRKEVDMQNSGGSFGASLEKVNGSLINRTVNTLAVDVTQTAFEVLADHTARNEEWIAYARVRQDLSYLLSSNSFKRTMNRNTPGRFAEFEEAARDAVLMPTEGNRNRIDDLVNFMAKGPIAANIAMRLWTATKQLLSAPAFWAYSQNPDYLMKLGQYAMNFRGNWKWAKENLPSFYKRIEEGLAASSDIVRELDSMSDGAWKRFFEGYSKLGMAPNKLVDGLTCAAGARAIYEHEYKKLKKQGLSAEEARRQALRKADIAYNETQQSNVGAMKSHAQVSNTAMGRLMTVYQQANIGYTRKAMLALGDLAKGSVGFAKQVELRMNLFGESRKEAGKRVFGRFRKAAIDLMMYGYGLKWLWDNSSKIFSAGMTRLFDGVAGNTGDDDEGDDDKDIENPKATKWYNDLLTAGGYLMQGTVGGNIMHDGLANYSPWNLLNGGELSEAVKLYDECGVSPELCAQVMLTGLSYFGGVHHETWANILGGVADIAHSLVDEGYDADMAMDVAFILNMPMDMRKMIVNRRMEKYSPMEYAEAMAYAMKETAPGALGKYEYILTGGKPLTEDKLKQYLKDYESSKMAEGAEKAWESVKEASATIGKRKKDDDEKEGVLGWDAEDEREKSVRAMTSIENEAGDLINAEMKRSGGYRKEVIENLSRLRVAVKNLAPAAAEGKNIESEIDELKKERNSLYEAVTGKEKKEKKSSGRHRGGGRGRHSRRGR